MKDLGTLSPVSVRKVWEEEHKHFTPWLADHVDLLGDALGLDLVLVGREREVDGFRVDLLFREQRTGSLVVVENMLERTDHDHLGKLITYAAGLDDARYVVLIAPEYRDGHRTALTWLNTISADDFAFFGVVIEVWQIEQSRWAPRLRVDIKPDRWQRRVKADRKKSETSELGQAYQNFWSEFLPPFKKVWDNNKQAQPESSMHFFDQGRRFNAAFSEGGTKLRADRYPVKSDQDATEEEFRLLYSRKDEIEQAVGDSLVWDDRSDRDGFTVSLHYQKPFDVRSKDERWQDAQEWLTDAMVRMRKAFSGKLDRAG